MKKLSFFLFASLMLVVVGCSSDDDSPTGNDISSNPEEETVLDPADVTSGITIANATINNGTPPSPRGEIAFTKDNTSQSAFLKNGFDISFSAPDNYAGAYIQVSSTDGTKASSYFDVSAKKSKLVRKKDTGVFSTSSKMDNNNIEIDVDFGDAIPPGKFCYILCIYDDAGNISDPVEVCVEVEAWGGNPALVGTWNYTKLIENGVTILLGEESDCSSTTINCTNEQELVVENAFCYTLDAFKLTINNDGTYEYRSDETDNNLDFNASTETCTAVFKPKETSYFISKGNWAYNEEEKRMTLVEFEYVEAEGDQVFEGVEENGSVEFDGDVVIEGSTLIVKVVESEEDNTTSLEYYFSK